MNFRILLMMLVIAFASCAKKEAPKFKLVNSEKVLFNSFVDCNMAEAWVGDTFRIFPGKYGEDPVWGAANELMFADGRNADEAFKSTAEKFTRPSMPKNSAPESEGLHGAVWFETVYQDTHDESGRTLFAVYHNENYPATLPFDSATGKGYINHQWPQGLRGPETATAVCRIGIMKSVDGGRSWNNRGLFIEDHQPNMILKPHNTAITFAGGVGDPSAVASGDSLYLFYGEYGYPEKYNEQTYDPRKEWSAQCISVARIALSDLDNPDGKAKRWNGKQFATLPDSIGKPIVALQIPTNEGGGAASAAGKMFHWGPSVSWNTYLNCWVMLMARAEGPSWQGGDIYISFNQKKDLGTGNNSQAWSKPALLVSRPGHVLWYPSLQPMNTDEDVKQKTTCLQLGKRARLYFKDQFEGKSEYLSEYIIEFEK